jgi:hypothetical protein
VAALSTAVAAEPFNALEPDQPPAAEHAVALLLDQVKVDELPEFTVLGVAVRTTAGAASATVTMSVCVAVPSSP